MTRCHSTESCVVDSYVARVSSGAGGLQFEHYVALTVPVAKVSGHTPPCNVTDTDVPLIAIRMAIYLFAIKWHHIK